jgi:putative resolvase
LLELLFKKQIGTLVLMHKDRLLRFGSELIFKLCNHLGVKVVILEPSPAGTALEQLSLDLVEIITVFSAKVYGMRSHANKSVLTS